LFGRCRALVKLSIQKAVHIWEGTDEYGWPEYIDEPNRQKMINQNGEKHATATLAL
jgi:hypothetical protein